MTSKISLRFFTLQFPRWKQNGSFGESTSIPLRALRQCSSVWGAPIGKVLDGRRSDNEAIFSFGETWHVGSDKDMISLDRQLLSL